MKNSAIPLKVNGTSCKCEQLQSVLTNVETIEEVNVRLPDQDEEELRDEMIVEQSSEICLAVRIYIFLLFFILVYFRQQMSIAQRTQNQKKNTTSTN